MLRKLTPVCSKPIQVNKKFTMNCCSLSLNDLQVDRAGLMTLIYDVYNYESGKCPYDVVPWCLAFQVKQLILFSNAMRLVNTSPWDVIIPSR